MSYWDLWNANQLFHNSFPQVKFNGLRNQGSTCYLNSVLQVLFMTEDFREAVERFAHDNPETEFIDRQLKDLFDELKRHTAQTKKITDKLKIRQVYEQRDAAEYFEKILKQTSSEASQVFHGTLTHRTICSHCEKPSDSDGKFWHLPLTLNSDGEYSVEDGISEYFRDTHFSGDMKMYCDNCDDKYDATIKCVLKHPPEVLMLLLKRFELNVYTLTYFKNNRTVRVPCRLQISENQVYDLYALVEHFGELGSGHYWATIKSEEDDKWYKFNDTTVTSLSVQPFQSDNFERSDGAYLLFYRKQSAAAACAQQDAGDVPTPEQCSPSSVDIYNQPLKSEVPSKEGDTAEDNCAVVDISTDQDDGSGLKDDVEDNVSPRAEGPSPEPCFKEENHMNVEILQPQDKQRQTDNCAVVDISTDQDDGTGLKDDVEDNVSPRAEGPSPEPCFKEENHVNVEIMQPQDKQRQTDNCAVVDISTDQDDGTGLKDDVEDNVSPRAEGPSPEPRFKEENHANEEILQPQDKQRQTDNCAVVDISTDQDDGSGLKDDVEDNVSPRAEGPSPEPCFKEENHVNVEILQQQDKQSDEEILVPYDKEVERESEQKKDFSFKEIKERDEDQTCDVKLKETISSSHDDQKSIQEVGNIHEYPQNEGKTKENEIIDAARNPLQDDVVVSELQRKNQVGENFQNRDDSFLRGVGLVERKETTETREVRAESNVDKMGEKQISTMSRELQFKIYEETEVPGGSRITLIREGSLQRTSDSKGHSRMKMTKEEKIVLLLVLAISKERSVQKKGNNHSLSEGMLNGDHNESGRKHRSKTITLRISFTA